MFDLVVKNARVFDGTALLDGLLSVGIAKNRISYPGPSAGAALKEIDPTGQFFLPGLPSAFVEHVDRSRRGLDGGRHQRRVKSPRLSMSRSEVGLEAMRL
jgi:hypothetical protein